MNTVRARPMVECAGCGELIAYWRLRGDERREPLEVDGQVDICRIRLRKGNGDEA